MRNCRIKPESFSIEKILSPDEIKILTVKKFDKNSLLYYDESVKFIVFKEGRAKSVLYKDGNSFTLCHVLKNNFYMLSIDSVLEFTEDSEIYIITDKLLFAKLFKNRSFMNLVMTSVDRSIQLQRDIIQDLVFNSCRKRVVTFLTDAANTIGIKQENGSVLVDIDMSISELSSFIASKRQTISCIISELHHDGLLEKVDSHKYLIKNITALKDIE